MKRYLQFSLFLPLLAACLLGLSACESLGLVDTNNDSLNYGSEKGNQSFQVNISKDSLVFSAIADSLSFQVITEGSWKIETVSQSGAMPFWITVSPDHGNGNTEVQVTVERNSTTRHRTLELRVKGTSEEKKLTLFQPAPTPYLEGECNIMEPDARGKVSENGGVVQICGVRVGNITIRSAQEDIIFDKTTVQAIPFYDFRATVPKCPTPDGRTLEFFVTVSTETGEITIPYSVEQSGN